LSAVQITGDLFSADFPDTRDRFFVTRSDSQTALVMQKEWGKASWKGRYASAAGELCSIDVKATRTFDKSEDETLTQESVDGLLDCPGRKVGYSSTTTMTACLTTCELNLEFLRFFKTAVEFEGDKWLVDAVDSLARRPAAVYDEVEFSGTVLHGSTLTGALKLTPLFSPSASSLRVAREIVVGDVTFRISELSIAK
jgi:hypothetical protein